MKSTEITTTPAVAERGGLPMKCTTLALAALAALAMLGCDQSDSPAPPAGCVYEELRHATSTTAKLSCTTASSELRSITITFECVVDDATLTGTSHRTSMVLNDQPFWDRVFVTRVRSFTVRVGDQTEAEPWVRDDAFTLNRFARIDPTLTARLPQAIATGTSAGLAVKGYGGEIPSTPPNQASAERWMKSCDTIE